MSTRDYPSVLADYQAALGQLYAAPAAGARDRGVTELGPGADLDRRAQTFEDRSAELGRVVAAARTSPDPEQRELAALQLLAGAAADLNVAADLAAEQPGDTNEPRSRSVRGVPAEILAVLSVPPSAGVRALAAAREERGARPTDPRAARAALRETAEAAVADILRDAATSGQVAFVGVTEIPSQPLKEAAGLLFHDLMVKLGEGLSIIVRRAVGLVLQALEKILTALGPGAWEGVRDQVVGWIDKFKEDNQVANLLTPLYQVPQVLAEVDGLIEGAASDTAAAVFNDTGARLEDLADRFEMQRKVIEWVARGLSWVRPWVVGVQPWGPPVLAGAYLSLIGYAVAAGGDYIDWYRVGEGTLLDVVSGVRTVVRDSLPPPSA
jgi:hypothetical protein